MTAGRQRIAITPVYNEGQGVTAILAQIAAHVDRLVVINDGSADESPAAIAAWMRGRPGMYFISSTVNRGQSTALRRGYALVSHLHRAGVLAADDLVVELDADGQHDPAYLPGLFDRWIALQPRVDVVLARRDFSNYPRYKRIGNWGLTLWASLLSGRRFHDALSNFRVTPVRVLCDVYRFFTGYRYSGSTEVAAILAALSYRTDNEFAVRVPLYRTGARVRDGFHVVWFGLRTWWRVKRGQEMPDQAGFLADVLRDLVIPGPEGTL